MQLRVELTFDRSKFKEDPGVDAGGYLFKDTKMGEWHVAHWEKSDKVTSIDVKRVRDNWVPAHEKKGKKAS